MKQILVALSLILVLGSCTIFQEPEYLGTNGYDVGDIHGREIELSAGIKVFNPNWYTLKIKPSELEVYVEDQLMGTIRLDKTVKMKAKRESDLELNLKGALADGAMITAVRYMNKDEVRVRIKGKVKGGVFIFSKKFEVDETRSVKGSDLKLQK